MNNQDIANLYVSKNSIPPAAARSNSVDGNECDMNNTGPEVTAEVTLGANPGDDSTLTVKLQERDDADDEWSDISGAVMDAIVGDTANQVVRETFYNRGKREVRAVGTIAGTSPSIVFAVNLVGRKVYD